MSPQAELVHLAQKKEALLRSIHARREVLAGQVVHALRPVLWVDSALAKWRKIAPILFSISLPLASLFKQKPPVKAGRRADAAEEFFRWAPLALSFVRLMR